MSTELAMPSGKIQTITDSTVTYLDPTGGRLVAWAKAASAANALAEAICKTAFVPEAFKGKPGDATAAILLGDELGLSPISSLRSIYVVHGVPAMYARPMVALVLSRGHKIWTVEESEARVTVAGKRRGSDHEERSTWTTARAQKAGYASNRKYQTDPIAMLYARAAGDVARRVAPDVLAGIPYTYEELELSDTETTTVTRSAPAKKAVQRKAKPKPAPVEDEPPFEDEPPTVPDESEPEPLRTETQSRALHASLRQLGIDDREAGLTYISEIVGADIASTKDLTKIQASQVLDAMKNRIDEQAAAVQS